MTDEEEYEDESLEDIDDDEFDAEVDDEIDLGDLDDEEVVSDFDDEPRRGGGTRDSDLLESNYEQAVKANPKRQSVQRKRRRLIEGILDTAELDTDEGRTKAWESLQKQASEAKPRDYSVKDEYTESDIVVHPKFGEGYVIEILSASKISVLFEDGVRRLAHNRG